MKAFICASALLTGFFLCAGCDSDDDPAVPAEPAPDHPEFVIPSSDYLNNRFFRLDLPDGEPDGRRPGDRIVPESLRIFRRMDIGAPQVGDLPNVAAYVDSLGCGAWGSLDFSNPCLYGMWWREIAWYPLVDEERGEFYGVDLNLEYADDDALAVIYEVRHQDGTVTRVGDRPGVVPPLQDIPGEDGLYYRMKLLKAPADLKEEHSFAYVLRNVYFLGGWHLDPAAFDLRIESMDPDNGFPRQDETGLDYIRIFGLDRSQPSGQGGPDGRADIHDARLFDLRRGLLSFSRDFPRPFAPGGRILEDGDQADKLAHYAYGAYADTTAFVWNPSYLREKQAWQIYDPAVSPGDYHWYAAFRIIAAYPGAGR